MNTEKTIVLKKEEKFIYRELTAEFIDNVCKYSELNRHLQEINQLFDVFVFNIERLFSSYVVQSDDCVTRKDGFVTDSSDFIAINSFVINIISSGRSLVDSIETCIKHTYGEKSKEYINFCNTSKIPVYEKYFSYRLFYELRNFSQHNHLPVSCEGNFFFFDIKRIINTPHFNYKKESRKEIEAILKEALEKYKDIFRVSFSFCIVEYVAAVAKLYNELWLNIKERLFALKKIMDDEISNCPDILNHDNPLFDGSIVFKLPETDEWQSFTPYADTDKYYIECLSDSEEFYKESNNELIEVEKHFKEMASKKD